MDYILSFIFLILVGLWIASISIKREVEAENICNPYVVETSNENIVVCKTPEGYIIKPTEVE